MSEERLQEIKDSVEFQKEILIAHNMETICVDEEQELIEEIERLNKQIEGIREERDYLYNKYSTENKWLYENLEKANNIIDELEKELDKEYDTYITNNVIYGKTFKAGANVFREHIKYKLQELKGSDKE